MHNFKKQFGQNFITDESLINGIVEDSKVNKKDVVVEVGAGMGSLTVALAKNAKEVISFEIDKDLISPLMKLSMDYPNIKFIFEDFMEFDFSNLNLKNFKVVSNLPYYITTVLISHFLKLNPISMTVMVQKEVAERIASKTNNKAYGAMSVICQHQAKIEITRIVKKEMFTPVPEVDSACLHFEFNKNRYDEEFSKFVYACFALKRKTLSNNFKKILDKESIDLIFSKFGLNSNSRAEQITPETFYEIFKFIKENKISTKF